MADRPRVLLACNQHVRDNYLAAADIERLEGFADWEWFECEGGGIYDTNEDPEMAAQLGERLGDFDGLVVCHGCPTSARWTRPTARRIRWRSGPWR